MAALDQTESTARRAVAASLADLDPGDQVTVGVSGGSDSMALALIAAKVAQSMQYDLTAVIVDHQLQPDSAAVAYRASEQLQSRDIATRVVSVRVGAAGGPEAAARTARMAALRLPGAPALLLGHTLDDQAETVLLGLGRGSGPRSIAGMASRAGAVRRPFLRLTRADTQHLCRLNGVTWWDDPHNSNSAFRRSRLRNQVMPLLEEVLGGGVAAALARTADQVRIDNDLLDHMAALHATTDVGELAALPGALRSRALRLAALEAGARPDELSAHHISELSRLVVDYRGQQRVELPGKVSCSRSGRKLVFGPTPELGG